MKEIFNVNFELKVFKYVSKEEMENHIQSMIKEGWTCERSGEYMLSPSSLVSDFCNKDNWIYTSEFSKKIEYVSVDKPTSYESELYWFDIYKLEEDL